MITTCIYNLTCWTNSFLGNERYWLEKKLIILYFNFTGFSYGQTIQPNQHEVYGEEGHHVTLSCNYSSAHSLLWYKQYPGSAPQFLLLILHTTGKITERLDSRLSAKQNTEKTCVELEISSVTVTDSALYHCALQPTVTGSPDTLYKNLTLPESEFVMFFPLPLTIVPSSGVFSVLHNVKSRSILTLTK